MTLITSATPHSPAIRQMPHPSARDVPVLAPGVLELPYEELYLYPGHSFSPLHDLMPFSSSPTGPHSASPVVADFLPLAFYTLRKTRSGKWELFLAVLEADEGDERVLLMEAELYPGAILHLPSSIYTSTNPLTPNPSTSLLVSDLQPSHPPVSSQPSAAGPRIIRLAYRQKAHVQAAAAKRAREEGVLLGWTKRIWGVGVKSTDERVKRWKALIELQLDAM